MFPTTLTKYSLPSKHIRLEGRGKYFHPQRNKYFCKKADRMQSKISVVDPVYIVKYYVHLKLVLLLIACEQCV